uniref:MFS transporter n=1 Tax=Geoglobus ahangari TaxID=113653 RepID=A0A7C3YH73_9EURY
MKKTIILSLTLLPMMISSGMVYSVLPIYIVEELKATKTEVGSIFTLGAFSGMVTAYIFGKIADRIGRKPLILAAQIGFSMVMLFYSLISQKMFAYFIQILEGMSWAMLGVTAPAMIADLSKKHKRGEAMGIYSTSWNFGWVVGPFFGGILSESFGFRFMLKVSFVMLIIGFTASYFVLKRIE